MDSNFNAQGDFQGDFLAGFEGDFQGFEQDIWGGTEPWMQPMVPDDNIDWLQWMGLDPMVMCTGPGAMDDWGAESQSREVHLGMQQWSLATIDLGLDQAHASFHETIQDLPRINTYSACQGPFDFVQNQYNEEHPQSGMSDIIPLGEPYFSHSKTTDHNCTLIPPFREEGPYTDSKITTKKPGKSSTERLRCPRPGCNLTFSRKSDLQRHEKGVHNPQVAIYCPVYGCKRVDKPFPRADKFMEHMRKHSHMYQYLCIFNNCDVSPRTKEELLEHLNAHHRRDCCSKSEQVCLDSLGWRQTALSDGSVLFESKHNCPLAFLGCEYRENVRAFGKGRWQDTMKDEQHLESHDFIDRSKAFEAIDKTTGKYRCWAFGQATCPICQDKFSNGQLKLLPHLREHSKEERMSKATDLAEMFRPCLPGKARWGFYAGFDFGAILEAELTEAGVIPKIVE